MYPAFQIARDWPAVQVSLGTNPTRFWPFGHAPQSESRPYAVHQLVYGSPDNSLSCVPREDNFGVQVDCYAKTPDDAREVATSLRDAFENSHNPIVGWNGEFWEQETGLWRVSFTVEFWVDRGS